MELVNLTATSIRMTEAGFGSARKYPSKIVPLRFYVGGVEMGYFVFVKHKDPDSAVPQHFYDGGVESGYFGNEKPGLDLFPVTFY